VSIVIVKSTFEPNVQYSSTRYLRNDAVLVVTPTDVSRRGWFGTVHAAGHDPRYRYARQWNTNTPTTPTTPTPTTPTTTPTTPTTPTTAAAIVVVVNIGDQQ
jgi:hypothetical protein